MDQHATWSVSSLHRVETAVGRYYFKATPTAFRREAVMTEILARRFPETIPRPTAIDEERGWMLTADFGDELVATMDPPYWLEALDTLGGLQRTSVASVASLLRSGFRDRRPRTLQSQVDDLASEGSEWLPDGSIRRLRAGRSRFHDLCEEVASSPIPNTLVHGDFHADNVVVSDGRCSHLRLDGCVHRAPIRRRGDVPAVRRTCLDRSGHPRTLARSLPPWMGGDRFSRGDEPAVRTGRASRGDAPSDHVPMALRFARPQRTLAVRVGARRLAHESVGRTCMT